MVDKTDTIIINIDPVVDSSKMNILKTKIKHVDKNNTLIIGNIVSLKKKE